MPLVDAHGKILVSTNLNQKTTFRYSLKIKNTNYLIKKQIFNFLHLFIFVAIILCIVFQIYQKDEK